MTLPIQGIIKAPAAQGPRGATGPAAVFTEQTLLPGANIAVDVVNYTHGAVNIGALTSVNFRLPTIAGVPSLATTPKRYTISIYSNAKAGVITSFDNSIPSSITQTVGGNWITFQCDWSPLGAHWSVSQLSEGGAAWGSHDYGTVVTPPASGLEISLYTFMQYEIFGTSLDIPFDIPAAGKRAIVKIGSNATGARTIVLRKADGQPVVWIGGTPAWSSVAGQWDQVEVWATGSVIYGKLLGLNTT